jgi:hypothetical protein
MQVVWTDIWFTDSPLTCAPFYTAPSLVNPYLVSLGIVVSRHCSYIAYTQALSYYLSPWHITVHESLSLDLIVTASH